MKRHHSLSIIPRNAPIVIFIALSIDHVHWQDNKNKQSYLTLWHLILSVDNNRVILSTSEDGYISDYINASYIKVWFVCHGCISVIYKDLIIGQVT